MQVRLPLLESERARAYAADAAKELGEDLPRWAYLELGRHRMRLLITRVAEHMIMERRYDLRSVPAWIYHAYRDDQANPGATAVRNLRNRFIRPVLRRVIMDWAEEQGFDDKVLAQMYRDTFEVARVNGKPEVMRNVANDIAEMRGKKTRTEASLTFDYMQTGGGGKGRATLRGAPENLLPEFQKGGDGAAGDARSPEDARSRKGARSPEDAEYEVVNASGAREG